MSSLRACLKLVQVAAIYAFLAPVQIVSRSLGLKLSRKLPVFAHRAVIRTLGIRIATSGEIPGRKPTLVVSNHVSWLDIIVVGSLHPISFIAKAEVQKWPVFGTLARLQDSIFIDRQRRKATAEANATIARRLSEGDAVVLFAEGTTGDGTYLLPFRSSLIGAAHAALAHDAENGADHIDIKPLAIAYTRRNGLPITRRDRPKIAWYGDMELFPHLWAFLREGPLDVAICWGESLPLCPDMDRKAITASIQNTVQRNLYR